MFMLGAMGESPESDPTPAIARFVNVEPSALLNAPPWLALLTTLATTSSAVISPFRMFTLAALAVLCAPVSAVPISPDVMLLRKSDDRAPATFSALPSASAVAPSVPEPAGREAVHPVHAVAVHQSLLPFTGSQCAWMLPSVHDPCSTTLPPVK